jgi:hypothetical protein
VAAVITDGEMAARLETVRAYTTVLLKKGPAYVPHDFRPADQAAIVREHGRRNMSLSDDGKLAIVGPLTGAGDIVGLCIFSVPEAEVREIMDADGAVQASIFTYDIVTLYGFPGDGLPEA